jgi:hypothetical protein
MPDKDFGDHGRPIIEKMGKHRGQAIDHLKAERKIYRENLPFFYEVKMRLLNPKFRPDLAGAKGRSVEDNLKHFGQRTGWTSERNTSPTVFRKQIN